MKKLLVLTVFMSLAIFASATTIFDVWVNGQAWGGESVAPSDEITIIVVDPVGGGFGGFGDYSVNGSAGDYIGGEILDAGLSILPSVSGSADGNGGFNVLITGSGFAATPAGQQLASFTFHVPEVDPSTYIDVVNTGGSFNNDFGSDRPSVQLHVIPEPMTMSLLALGGLGLIRRRRA